MLLVATILSFLIFFMSQVNIVLAAALIALYLFYLWVSSTRESEEPELIGASLLLALFHPCTAGCPSACCWSTRRR